jgi:sugar phosphate isomerase/epimerase
MNRTRRDFLKQTALASALPMMSPLTTFASMPIAQVAAKAGFELLFMQTDWGFKGTIDEFCAATKKEGYDGIEVWWPGDEQAPKLFEALRKHKLEVGFLCGGHQADFSAHFALFKANSGKDYFSYEDNKQIIDYVTTKRSATGIPIYHETHRGRMMFAATVAKNFIDKNPAIRLTLDISHWCVVHESLLADQKQTIDLLLEKVDHIHSRIGHPQGAQVSDPRAPEWESTIKAHLAWWDTVIARKKKNGERMTILTEFGPPDYMPTLPYTRQPVADQWAINVHMMNLLKKRYL